MTLKCIFSFSIIIQGYSPGGRAASLICPKVPSSSKNKRGLKFFHQNVILEISVTILLQSDLKGVGVADFDSLRSYFLDKLAELISLKLVHLEVQLFTVNCDLKVI